MKLIIETVEAGWIQEEEGKKWNKENSPTEG